MPNRMLFAVTLTVFLGVQARAQSYTASTIYDFGSSAKDGNNPVGTMAMDHDGDIYGVTSYGGSAGFGTVFKVDSTGNETILHSFRGGADGAYPMGAVTLDAAGTLFGTASMGGITHPYTYGYGTVFKITAEGSYSILYKFHGGDGEIPMGELTLDIAGNLYGPAASGGAHQFGSIFKISPSGHETTLYSFTGGLDGSNPEGNLLRNKLGEIYGTTLQGGPFNGGVVFKLSPSGIQTVLHAFCAFPPNCTDGDEPLNMVRTADGNFYGNTNVGGAVSPGTAGQGVIFKTTAQGVTSALYTFCPQGTDAFCTDGELPYGPMVAAGGNLYGTTESGGDANRFSPGAGVVYEVTPAGVENVLFRFPNDFSRGMNPQGLSIDSAGNLYGVTFEGGRYDKGVIFKLTKNP